MCPLCGAAVHPDDHFLQQARVMIVKETNRSVIVAPTHKVFVGWLGDWVK